MRQLPLGVSDFKKIIQDGYSYVDKTLFIEEILRSGAAVALIPRPRRFGKTTNLSMLYYFFSNEEKDSKTLFQNLKIEKSAWVDSLGRSTQEYMGQFPSIFFTLKDVDEDNWKDAYKAIEHCLGEVFDKYRFLLKAKAPGKEDLFLEQDEREKFESILYMKASKIIVKSALKFLISLLYRYYQKEVIVLIDEYDAPIHAGYLHGFYKEIISFMKIFFGGALKDNSLLKKAVLTGILRVSKESIFSGFNNGTCYTILKDDFADKFGLLEEEVESLFKEQQVSYKIEEIRNWYNGYLIGNMSIYNPWSIIQCIANKGLLQPYWVNTSSNELIKKLLWKGEDSFKKDMEKLLQGESITKSIEEGIIFSDLESLEDAVWGLFFFGGYLTLAKNVERVWSKQVLIIPNLEVLELYKGFIQNWLENNLSGSSLSEMLQSLVQGKINLFAKLFQQLILNAMSFHDLDKNSEEKVYHAFVLGLLVALEKTHEVKSNRESGYGRYDVCIIPRKAEQLGIVIEFKKADEDEGEDLLEAATAALQQIDEKNYAAELHGRGIAKVLTLGIAFQGKKVLVLEGSRS